MYKELLNLNYFALLHYMQSLMDMFAKYIMRKPRVFKIWNAVVHYVIKKLTTARVRSHMVFVCVSL